jgi:CRP/FNR family transcriptional regulator, cyclic AMP receptor protein
MERQPSPLLHALSPADRALLVDRAVTRRLRTGAILHLTGDPPGRVHVVSSGAIKLMARHPGGRESILGLVLPGGLVGAAPALDGLPQANDAVALTECEVLGLDGSVLMEVLARNPLAAIEVARTLSAQVRWLSGTALERTSSSVPARLAGRLLELADLAGRRRGDVVEVELPLDQSELASLAGMSRESACKAIQRFRSQGLVDYHRRRLRILRPDLLEEVKCDDVTL